MTGDLDEQNLTKIHIKYGAHDKTKNVITVFEPGDYPLNIPENFELFGVTGGFLFTENNAELDKKIQSRNIYLEFLKKIKFLLYILVVPGLIISIIRVITFLGITNYEPSSIFSSTNLINHIAFWLSVLASQFLWFDIFYENKNPVKVLEITPFTTNKLSHIQKNSVDFSEFSLRKLGDHIHNQTADLIAEATIKGNLNLGLLWKQLMSLEQLERAYLRLHLVDSSNIFIDPKKLFEYLKPYNIPVYEFLLYSIEETALLEDKFILPEHLFLALWKLTPSLKEILYQQNLTVADIRELGIWIKNTIKEEEQDKFWKPNIKIKKTGGIFRSWIYGYTFYLNRFSTDLTEEAAYYKSEFGIGHLKETSELINALGKSTRGNVLVVGDSGIGKTSIIKGLAQRIISGNVPDHLRGFRIISVNVAEIIASASSFGGLEQLIIKIMNEITKAGNVILFIDELHTIIGAKAENTSDLSNLLVPYISDPKLKIVGTTTYQDYKSKFEFGGTLATSFDIIEANEPSIVDTIRILETLIPKFEQKNHVFVSLPAIKNAILLSQKYMPMNKLPNKAIAVLEEACIKRSENSSRDGSIIVTTKDVQEIISIKTSIPVTSVGEKEARELLELEERMKRKIVGQEDAIKAVAEALKRSRSGVRSPNKPIASFLFMGPTGVGKTYISKTLAELYFGSKNKIIRLDMSEYQEPSAISRIIGSDQVVQSRGMTLIDQVKTTPYTIILLDELEKAHKDLLTIFLQLFDEGRLTNTAGETIDFTNTIIIATSNIGTKQLQDALNQGYLFQDAQKKALLELHQRFPPEFINRFDQIIVFHPLSEKDLIEIVKLQLNELAERLEEKGMHLTYTDQAPLAIAKKGYAPEFGAREIHRVIADFVEQKVANMILENKLKRGDRVEVTAEWLNS